MVGPSSPSSPISLMMPRSTASSRYASITFGNSLSLRIAARGVAHHALFFGELAFQVERILPNERDILHGTRALDRDFACGLAHGRLLDNWNTFESGTFTLLQHRRLDFRARTKPNVTGPQASNNILFGIGR